MSSFHHKWRFHSLNRMKGRVAVHERSLVTGLFAEVDRLVGQQAPPARATHLVVSIGRFSGVDPDLFQSAFDEMSLETRHHGAQLSIEEIELQAACGKCGHEFTVERFQFHCPICHHEETTIVRGESLVLERVTMEPISTLE